MKIKSLCLITFVSVVLGACGGEDSGGTITLQPLPTPTPEPTAEPTPTPDPTPTPTPTPTAEPAGPWTCPTDDSDIYFCDDFEDGTYLDKWDDLAATTATTVSGFGTFDILDEDGVGKSLRFNAGKYDTVAQGELILVKADQFSVPSADYYVEYRIRPRDNSSTSSKQLYAMARYQGELQWYLGGLNMQGTVSGRYADAGYAASGAITRTVQVQYPFDMGSKNSDGTVTDGTWYNMRLDVIGSTLTLYVDGIEQGSWEDTSSLYTSAGLVGFYTKNRSFEIDWVKVGNAAVKPVQLALDYTHTSWVTAADGDDLVVNVTAITSDGTTPDTFTAVSSDESVVSATIDGSVVTLSPVAQGSATITFTSGSDASVSKVIQVVIEPAWNFSTTSYGDVSSVITPTSSAYVDETFSIEFDSDSALELGTTGEIRIFDSSNLDKDSAVDRIRVAGETEYVGYDGQSDARILETDLIWIEGNTLYFQPHSQALSPDTAYTIAIGANVVNGAKLNTVAFDGLGSDAGWTFTTNSAPASSATSLQVDDDGTADFRSVQGALDWVMEKAAGDAAFVDTPFTINVAAGVYNGLYYISGKNNLTIVGENAADSAIGDSDIYSTAGKTVIQGANNLALNGDRYLFLANNADMLTLDSLTLKNNPKLERVQAEALRFKSSSNADRLIVTNSQIISEQDTLWLSGYNWFYNSMIAGNVDFIWGNSVASIFEESQIHMVGDSKYGSNTSGNGGYILQARVDDASYPGYVFLNSEFTHGAGPTNVTINTGSAYLARTGFSSSYYDNIAFINTKVADHITADGYFLNAEAPAPNPATASAASGWREFNTMDSSGTAVDISSRCSSTENDAICYELTQAEVDASFCSSKQIFAIYDGGLGWDPKGDASDTCVLPSANDGWTEAGFIVGDPASDGYTGITKATGSIVSETDTTLELQAYRGKMITGGQSFYFAYKNIDGNFILTAKLKSLSANTYQLNQFPIGLMMCDCSDGDTTPLFAEVGLRYKNDESGYTSQYGFTLAAGDGWSKADVADVTPGDSLYFRLERRNDTAFYAFVSSDGGTT